jgi:hypothetical protein
MSDTYKLAEQIEAELSGEKPFSVSVYAFHDETPKEVRVSLIFAHLIRLIDKVKQ